MRKTLLGFILLILSFTTGFGQSSKQSSFFCDPIIVDSSSSVIIPIRYKENIFTSSKIGNGYYANIIFYNSLTDSSKSIFKANSFIREFKSDDNYYRNNTINTPNIISSNWVFYFVKEDYNKNGHIDYKDPSVLYVSDKQGNGLRSITAIDKNAISINIYDKLGFALIKIQSDSNNDKDFDSDDKEYYFVRLDLKTLTLGNNIEMKN